MTGPGKNFEPVFASRDRGPLFKRLHDANIKTYVVGKRGILGIAYIMEFLRIIKSEKIDIVHLNTLTPFCKYAGIAGFIKKIPVVWVIRENPLISRSIRLKFWLKLLSSKVVFVDRDTRNKLLPETEKDVMVIYNGVDTKTFRPSASEYLINKYLPGPGQMLVGYIGSITRRKGLEYLVRAMAVIKGKNKNVKLVIIGDHAKGDEPYFLHLMETIKELSLGSDVVFTGLLPDVRDALNSLDLVVLPSLEERCSRSLLESLACGKAVVATRVGGNAEIVKDGWNGFLVEPENEKHIAESILRILEDDDLRKQMGKRGRELAEKKFDIQENVNKMCELYLELMKK